MLLGYFSARIGDDSHKTNPQTIGRKNYNEKANDNGKQLVALCQQAILRQVQLRFPQPCRRQWTWKHPHESKAHLDYILVNTKWVTSITNCRAFDSVELDSDHRIVSANFRIRFRKFKQTPSDRVKYDWNKAIESQEIHQQYQLELENCFDVLSYDDGDSGTLQKLIAKIIAEAAKKVIENPPKCGSQKWVSDATMMLVPKRDNTKRRYHQRKSTATKERSKNLAKQFQASYLEDERRFMERDC